MNRINYIAVILFFCLTAKAQELVPNGSFENITSCPVDVSTSQIYKAPPWTNANPNTADLFNICNTSALGVPTNFAGNQQPRTGVGYAGILTYGLYREYIQAPLLDTLVAGHEYCLTLYVSLGDNVYTAVNNLGAYFSDSAVYTSASDSTPLPFIPQIENSGSNSLANKSDWVVISGSFIASGGEKYITIGNFNTNANSDTINYLSTGNTSYCYIEDISLTECTVPPPSNPPTEAGIVVPNVFTPNGDGINDVFSIESTGIENISCEVFDRWGIKVASITRINEGWDGRTTSGQEAIEGVYFYVVSARGADGKELSRKGFVQLLR